MYDYELIVGDNGKRLLAFGKYAGRAGLIDFLHGLGMRMCQCSLTIAVMNLQLTFISAGSGSCVYKGIWTLHSISVQHM